MSTEFRLPELGENIDKGDLVKVLVSPGDVIAKDQPVIELETDKATLEVPSSVSGKVEAIHVKAGEKVKVGQVILTVGDGAPLAEDQAKRPVGGKAASQKVDGKELTTQGRETAERAGEEAVAPASVLELALDRSL